MTTMIERVARAIDPLAWTIPERRREAKQFAALSQARRAIEAMREPTLAQMIDGQLAIPDDDLHPTLEEVGECYRAMIDAALKE